MKAVHLGSVVNNHFTEMVAMLTLCLTLEEDDAVQSILRPEGTGRFCIRPGERAIWIEIGAGKPGLVHRTRPRHLTEIILRPTPGGDKGIAQAIQSSGIRDLAHKRASAMIASFVSMTEMPTRHTVANIMRWAAALEGSAYGAGASISTVIDRERRLLFARSPQGGQTATAIRRRYWEMLNLMGRMLLLSAPTGARDGLLGTANSFDRATGTPSWPLVRERNLWLAAIAARVAAAFGTAIVDRYLETLRRVGSPVQIIDALLGVTAIGLGSPSHLREILAELERSIEHLRGRNAFAEPVVRLAAVQAIEILQDPKSACELSEAALTDLGMEQTLFTPKVLKMDGAMPVPPWGYPALSALPVALNSPVHSFFPLAVSKNASLRLGLSNADIEALITRAWSGEKGMASSALLVGGQFEC